VGWGFDAHRFGGDPPIVLAGIVVDPDRGLVATSDGDVAAHAVADALLGAAALADLGELFPSSDPRWEGADSMSLLAEVVRLTGKEGWEVAHVDVTVVAQSVRVAPHREGMRRSLADVLGVAEEVVSVKATTTDHMGSIGRDEGVAAVAVVTVVEAAPPA
jgi:2-C-methyl-D-erythritol 2,4-cyclodiphosphate synthase